MSIIMKVIRNLSYAKLQNRLPVSYNTLQNKNRQFHLNQQQNIKMFVEHENKFAYDIMENKGYAISLVENRVETVLNQDQFNKLIQQDWSKKGHQDIIEAFPKLGTYCSNNNLCITNQMFDEYIDNLTDNIRLCTDKELISVFYSLCKWPETESVRSRNYIEVWAALDAECYARRQSWSYDELLSYVALFYMLNVSKASDFSVKTLQKMASRAKNLTAGQLVQTLFYVGIMRRPPFDMHNLEIHLENKFSEFTVDELAIMSMGFFKSKTPIRSMSLVRKIINVVMVNAGTVHEVTLAALLKIIRYSMKTTTDDIIYSLLDSLQHEVPRVSIMCNVHIALLGTATLTMHEGCLLKIAETVSDKIKETRVKDMERLILSYGTFNCINPTTQKLVENVIKELKTPERDPEIRKFSKSFACCISYMGLLSVFPEDLINKALSPEFLLHTYGKQCYNYGREVLVLHNLSQIFCDDVVIQNRLTDKAAKVLAKRYTDYMPDEKYSKQLNVSERMIVDVISNLKEIQGGDDFVVGDHIITHHQRGDIIICNTRDGQPVKVIDVFSKQTFGLVRKKPDDNTWIVFVIAGRNALIRNRDIPTGQFRIKLRELTILGYCPVLVPWSIYDKLQTKEQKQMYLKKVINETINKK